MYQESKMKQTLEGDDLTLMHVYLRSQASRFSAQKMDWFFDQPELLDDGDHPLLEDDNDPRYSREVMRRAFATWVFLDNKNPFKFVCNYFHTLEKMGENSPQHVHNYVKRGLETPASFQENPDQMFAQNRRPEFTNSGSPFNFNQNRPCYYRHHVDNSYLRNQPQIQSDLPITEYARSPSDNIWCENRNTPTDVYEKYCKTLANKLYGPDQEEIMKHDPNIEGMIMQNDVKVMCQSQVSIDSPSKSSENDSCYQSMSSPLTDHEE